MNTTQSLEKLLTEEQRMFVSTARDFASNRLRPNASRWDETGEYDIETLSALGDLGFMGMSVAEAWGGVGADCTSSALSTMEIAAGDAATSTIMSVHNTVCTLLANHANDEQKARLLKPLARGEQVGAFALTEPQAGSDASNLLTKAEKKGGGWRLNGTKQFVTNAPFAKTVVVFAVTDASAGKKGISAFAVQAGQAGFEVMPAEKKLGIRASGTSALVFENVEVAACDVIGRLGEGYKIALSTLESGRIGIASQATGIASEALSRALDYAHTRKAFGKPIYELQAVQFRLAECMAQLEMIRQVTLHAARLKDAGHPCLKEACIAKLQASELAERIVSDCLQTYGGYGFLHAYELERMYRDVRICKIYEGTSDIQKLLIARHM